MKQVLFLGAPGVGKGTYARRAAPILGFGHISPGDLLRASVESRLDVLEYLKKGTLVPESLVFSLVSDRLRTLTSLSGVIFDGFPRSQEQAAGWLAQPCVTPPDLVVEFHLPEDLLVQKLLGRRTCGSCGDLYNMYSFTEGEFRMPAMLPKRDGVCDKCGGTLVRRVDDSLEVIKHRLESHWKNEQELIQYIKDHCDAFVRFDVKTGIAQLDELIKMIEHHLANTRVS